ncbi:uncharacterized protein LOC62_06G008553 [Vanrija pseudolonga]|uniref:Uncharacterized protein n=1 Tax=Vanrija pseudolonga TaxID=143232 RepID=A0AAF0YE39_9TREE|nr:hypothetical protein LOC62_06G008553 [Vanrija pseudolonga]
MYDTASYQCSSTPPRYPYDMTDVVQTKQGVFSRLFAPKPTPELDALESEGHDRKKAKQVLASYDGDVARARGKLQHDQHATDVSGAPLPNFPYVKGCSICDARAATDAAVRDSPPQHPADHVRYDPVTNTISYADDCDVCDALRGEDTEGKGPFYAMRNDRHTAKAHGMAMAMGF